MKRKFLAHAYSNIFIWVLTLINLSVLATIKLWMPIENKTNFVFIIVLLSITLLFFIGLSFLGTAIFEIDNERVCIKRFFKQKCLKWNDVKSIAVVTMFFKYKRIVLCNVGINEIKTDIDNNETNNELRKNAIFLRVGFRKSIYNMILKYASCEIVYNSFI